MNVIPTKLILPLPEFLTADYLHSVTFQELLEQGDFVEYMTKCDELVTTSDELSWYIDLFTLLMVGDDFMPPTSRHFAGAVESAKKLPITPTMLERGVELCIRLSGPNEALPNVFAAYEVMTTVRNVARHAAEQIGQRGQKVTDRFHRLCAILDQLTVLTFLMAVKVQLGIAPPDSWQQPFPEEVSEDSGPLASSAAAPTADPATRDAMTAERLRKQEEWSIWTSANLLGKANILLSWYWDGDTASEEEDEENLRDGMKVARALLTGKSTAKFRSYQWFALFDAVASYPEPDEELEALTARVRRKYEEAVRREVR